MTADHLTARQQSVPTLAQHPLTDTDVGLFYRSPAGSTPWDTREASSTIRLPRMGRAGCYLSDVRAQPPQAQHYSPATGVTLECVFATTTSGFNFSGGLWGRDVVYYNGPYAFFIGICYTETNDNIAGTTARAYARVADVGQDHIASRTVHSRPVINDGLAHHLCLTHAGSPTLTNAVKLYVDGTLVETSTLKSGCEMFNLEANYLNAGVEAYFTQPEGAISHVCLTPQVLSAEEIAARANLVKPTSTLNTTAEVMVWSSAQNQWIPNVKGYDRFAGWYPVKRATLT